MDISDDAPRIEAVLREALSSGREPSTTATLLSRYATVYPDRARALERELGL